MRQATPSTLPIVASVRHIGVPGVPDAGLGKAMPQETISLELSVTGLSVASRDESALRLDPVVVVVFIWCLPEHEKARETRTFLCVEPGPYARTAPLVL
jgi:hypothetical protein